MSVTNKNAKEGGFEVLGVKKEGDLFKGFNNNSIREEFESSETQIIHDLYTQHFGATTKQRKP